MPITHTQGRCPPPAPFFVRASHCPYIRARSHKAPTRTEKIPPTLFIDPTFSLSRTHTYTHLALPPALTGNTFAMEFLERFPEGFLKNNHNQTLGPLMADFMSWDWSDGTRGEGPKDMLLETLKNGWGMLVSRFIMHAPTVVVDTEASKVLMCGPIVINVDGGLPDEANLCDNACCFTVTLDEHGKMVKFDILWDNKSETLVKALGQVMGKIEASK